MNRKMMNEIVEGATTYGQEQYADTAIKAGFDAVVEYAKSYADGGLNLSITDAEATEAALEIIHARCGLEVAEPTSRCLSGTNDFWAAQEWREDGRRGHDFKISIYYLFDEKDIIDDNGEPLESDQLPFDGKHVSRIEVQEIEQ